ncbi:helix-turn-helix domain-containing protein [Streptomyces sp. NPDC095614]|uniref:helix-turn-helix domain-containing protein n=1 Tax=Streptomyces sp. NPDC095614 TaxID=3156692 RepID=UPI0033214380
MTADRKEAPNHRTLYCVKQFGCQRPECRARANEYTRSRYRKVGYGTWKPYVEAQPVRDHVAALREAGASTTAIAEAAGVSTATLGRILYGHGGQRPDAKMRPESAAALLAVRAEDCRIADGSRVDATGTRRRIQALVAMGWSFTALAPEMGIHSRPLGDMARGQWVSAGSARKVKAAYKRLVHHMPEQRGVQPQARALAKRVAAREGWVPPGAWDDIDDPAAMPEVDEPKLPSGRKRHGTADLNRVLQLTNEGLSAADIALRLGVHKRTVTRARRRARRASDEQAAA